MKKTLILAAALTAAGVATSMAQVYSVNAVGYVNQTIPNGFSLIANPFVNATNTLNALLDPNLMGPGGGSGVTVFRFRPGTGPNTGFLLSSIDPLGFVWLDDQGNPNGDTESIIFGDGIFIQNLTGAPFTVTWVGEVAQGTLNTTVQGPGFSIKSSKVPQAGKLQTDLLYPTTPGDVVYKWNSVAQGYVTFENDPVGGGTAAEWRNLNTNQAEEPSLAIAESVFINNADVAKTWSRTFTVN